MNLQMNLNNVKNVKQWWITALNVNHGSSVQCVVLDIISVHPVKDVLVIAMLMIVKAHCAWAEINAVVHVGLLNFLIVCINARNVLMQLLTVRLASIQEVWSCVRNAWMKCFCLWIRECVVVHVRRVILMGILRRCFVRYVMIIRFILNRVIIRINRRLHFIVLLVNLMLICIWVLVGLLVLKVIFNYYNNN